MSRPGAILQVADLGAPLALTNLLNDIDALAPLLVERVAAGDLLDGFLLAAGMQQITEDHLHRDPFFLHRAAGRLRRRLPRPWGRIAAAMADQTGGVLWRAKSTTVAHHATTAWLADLRRLGQSLADRLMARPPGEEDPAWQFDRAAETRALAERVSNLPDPLRRGLLRLPSCFRSFDQALEDVATLAAMFSGRWSEPVRHIIVAGIRSSGCYLAPLVAARLRQLGLKSVEVATLRPGQRWLKQETRFFRQAANNGGIALVIDDPPRSWGSVAGAARELARQGFSEDRIVLLLATFPDSAQPPAELHAHPAVLLPFADWAICQRLAPDRVHESLARLLADQTEVLGVRPLGDAAPLTTRGHAHAVYEVDLRSSGETSRRLVQARGVGLGYFGAHALAIAERLQRRITRVYGLDRGVLFEAWPVPDSRLGAPLASRQAAAIATYVAERAQSLPLSEDLTQRLLYRGAAWQWAGAPFGGLFGRASDLGRLLGTALVRRLLTVDNPAVIDNRTYLGAFAAAPEAQGVIKCDFDTGVFSSDDLFCFDPVADVALAAASADAASGERLRQEFEMRTGSAVEPERWLLYQLVHVLASHEKGPAESRHIDLRPARLLQRYYREVLLSELEPNSVGPVCAIDLDGVLETMPLGFPATSPTGALALRALNLHGYRPVLASGRSLDEVRDRCTAYGLGGGVAEYGTVVYLSPTGEVRSLLERPTRSALERLRAMLTAAGDVHLDPAFQHSVRVFRLDGRGRRRALPDARVAQALAAGAEGRLRAVQGHYQTDFIAAGANKARGLRVLAEALGTSGETPLAMAIGDTASDLEMLRLAKLSFAPGNADAAVKSASGVTVVRPAAQAGFSVAVARLIGHRPGACGVCAPPRLASSSQLLLDLLAVENLSRLRKAVRAARLLCASRRPS